MPFQPGNQCAKKDKLFAGMIKRRLMEDDWASLKRIVTKLISRAEEGDNFAVKEIMDRVDGKSVQPVSGDEEGAPIRIEMEPAKELVAKIRGLLQDDSGVGEDRK